MGFWGFFVQDNGNPIGDKQVLRLVKDFINPSATSIAAAEEVDHDDTDDESLRSDFSL